MKKYIPHILIFAALMPIAADAARPLGKISTTQTKARKVGDELQVTACLNLDSLHLGATTRCM